MHFRTIRAIATCALALTPLSCKSHDQANSSTTTDLPTAATIPYKDPHSNPVAHNVQSVRFQLHSVMGETISSHEPVELLVDGGNISFEGVECVARISVKSDGTEVWVSPLLAGEKDTILNDMRSTTHDAIDLDVDTGRSTFNTVPINDIYSEPKVTQVANSLLRTSTNGCKQWERYIAPKVINSN